MNNKKRPFIAYVLDMFDSARWRKRLRNWRNARYRIKEHEVQYKNALNTARPVYDDLQQGTLEVKFSPVADNGLIKETSYANRPVPPPRHEPAPLSEAAPFKPTPASIPLEMPIRYLDCPEMHAKFSVLGVRDGDIHILSEDTMGHKHTIIVEKVFGEKGRPVVKGLVIRHVTNDVPAKRRREIKGFINFDNYIGISAYATLPLEDILREGVHNARQGNSPLPAEIRAML